MGSILTLLVAEVDRDVSVQLVRLVSSSRGSLWSVATILGTLKEHSTTRKKNRTEVDRDISVLCLLVLAVSLFCSTPEYCTGVNGVLCSHYLTSKLCVSCVQQAMCTLTI